jgi:hypothetical protein
MQLSELIFDHGSVRLPLGGTVRFQSRAPAGQFSAGFSHVSPINTARNLTRASGSAGTRKEA